MRLEAALLVACAFLALLLSTAVGLDMRYTSKICKKKTFFRTEKNLKAYPELILLCLARLIYCCSQEFFDNIILERVKASKSKRNERAACLNYVHLISFSNSAYFN